MTGDSDQTPLEIDQDTLRTMIEESARHDRAFALLDVRELFELIRGILPQAILIPMGQLMNRINEIPKDREIICYCEHGIRSEAAALFLRSQGYDARSLAEGMSTWKGPVAEYDG
ncbi:sulfurtransferase [candidate division BRC1 bacterium HGW-BRC1-1]|nr:MAG: sulfurtransferase [candidate division BRC1 bacterium HGW-BRC1-1]